MLRELLVRDGTWRAQKAMRMPHIINNNARETRYWSGARKGDINPVRGSREGYEAMSAKFVHAQDKP